MNKALTPAIFIGHGSPMNAISSNDFTKFLNDLGQKIKKPKAIVLISAHWMTRGLKIESSINPKTIHDFYGFPKDLYEIQYPAKGDEQLVKRLEERLKGNHVEKDENWGLDHGAWSVLVHLFPKADVPVVQLSINQNLQTLEDHYNLAKELKELRAEGYMIMGSGNIVHNLREISFDKDSVMDWAREFDEYIKRGIETNNLDILLAKEEKMFSSWKRAHPSLEHYIPLLYVLGVAHDFEKATYPYEAFELGSLSMRAVIIA